VDVAAVPVEIPQTCSGRLNPTQKLFFLIRPDIYAYTTDHVRAIYQRYQREVVSERIIADYLRQNRVLKLQIGAGTNNFAGWLNTDIEPTQKQAYMDASKVIPFQDGSVHYIFGEHVIEHLTYEQGLSFLKETHRVLAAGGKVRMVTPNLSKFVALFNENSPEQKKAEGQYVPRKLDYHFWHETPDRLCFILNKEMRFVGAPVCLHPCDAPRQFREGGLHPDPAVRRR